MFLSISILTHFWFFPQFYYLLFFRKNCLTRSEEHTSELQSRLHLVCRLLLEKKTQTIAPRVDPAFLLTHPVTIFLVAQAPEQSSPNQTHDSPATRTKGDVETQSTFIHATRGAKR